jgi:hypothetical protein
MAEIAFKFDDKSPDEIRTMALEAKAGLTNNSQFPDAGARAANLGNKIAAYDEAKSNTARAQAALTLAQNAEAKTLEDICDELHGAKTDCEQVTRDPVKLASTRMPLKAARQPVGPLSRPDNFTVTRGDRDGDARCSCKKVNGARSYQGQHARSADGPWTTAYEGTKSSFTIGGLPPGDYFFRMRAFGTAGWSPWSDIAQCRVA